MTLPNCLEYPKSQRRSDSGKKVQAMKSKHQNTGGKIPTSGGSGNRIRAWQVARKPPKPNYEMLNALAQIEQIQQGMNPAVDDHSLEYLREARSGGMYDIGPDE
jgi:hypothetical protein